MTAMHTTPDHGPELEAPNPLTADDVAAEGFTSTIGEDTPDHPTRTLPFKLDGLERRQGVEVISDVSEPVTQVFVDDDGRRRMYVTFAMNLGKLAVVAYAGLAAFGFGQVIWSEADEYLRPLVQFVAPGVASAAGGNDGRGPEEADLAANPQSDAEDTVEQETPDVDGQGSTEVTPDVSSRSSAEEPTGEVDPPPDLNFELAAMDDSPTSETTEFSAAVSDVSASAAAASQDGTSQDAMEPARADSSPAGSLDQSVISNGDESPVSTGTGRSDTPVNESPTSSAGISPSSPSPSAVLSPVAQPAATQAPSESSSSESSSSAPSSSESSPTEQVAAPPQAAEVSAAYVTSELVTDDEAEELLASDTPPVVVDESVAINVENSPPSDQDVADDVDEPADVEADNDGVETPPEVDDEAETPDVDDDAEVELDDDDGDDDEIEVDDEVEVDDDTDEGSGQEPPGGESPVTPPGDRPGSGGPPVDSGPPATPPVFVVPAEPPVDRPGPPVETPRGSGPPVDVPEPPVETPAAPGQAATDEVADS